MGKGCAVASMLGLLEAREATARERVEDLREEAARTTAALEAAEIELERRVIAREELVEALAGSPGSTSPGTSRCKRAGVSAAVTVLISLCVRGLVCDGHSWDEAIGVRQFKRAMNSGNGWGIVVRHDDLQVVDVLAGGGEQSGVHLAQPFEVDAFMADVVY
jgi:hypothetical protein